MSANEPKKATVLPLSTNERGDVLGLVMDEHGVRPAEFVRVPEGGVGDTTLVTREGSPLLDAEFRGGAPKVTKGPSKVTSDAYRANYDRVFGKQPVAEA